MIIENFDVNGWTMNYGKFDWDPYNRTFIVEGVTSNNEFVRFNTKKVELELHGSSSKDKEVWIQSKPKNVKSSVVETPLEPIASAAQALASATPVSASATPVSATMTDTVPVVKRGRGRPRKVQQ